MNSHDIPKLGLAALFITSLITAQTLAVKVLAIPLPFSIPVVGNGIIVPAGVIAYAITFFASDGYAELYGRRSAQVMVNIGFLMNLVWLTLLWVAIISPGSQAGVDPAAFSSVLSPSTNIVIGSLVAYIVSQNWDVIAFHEIGAWTEGRFLWLRNIGSTVSSQLIDTVIFVVLAFFLVPILLGTGTALPYGVLIELILGQYVIKILIALVDTPFVYAAVSASRNLGYAPVEPAMAD